MNVFPQEFKPARDNELSLETSKIHKGYKEFYRTEMGTRYVPSLLCFKNVCFMLNYLI